MQGGIIILNIKLFIIINCVMALRDKILMGFKNVDGSRPSHGYEPIRRAWREGRGCKRGEGGNRSRGMARMVWQDKKMREAGWAFQSLYFSQVLYVLSKCLSCSVLGELVAHTLVEEAMLNMTSPTSVRHYHPSASMPCLWMDGID